MIKSFLKSAFPRGARAYGKVKDTVVSVCLPARDAEAVFSKVYEENLWADSESVSGAGSTLVKTEVIRQALPALLTDLGANSMLDAPCGDFNWMQHVELGRVRYVGADVVPGLMARNQQLYGTALREFVALDITRDRLPRADVILCRDCFLHLSFRDIRAAVANFKSSNAEYLLATTYPEVTEHRDIATGPGGRYVNLQLSPFKFPEPLKMIVEDGKLGKHLGLWRLQQL